MDTWEYCFVDMLNHDVHYITSEGLKREKVKRDKGVDSDSKDDATARFVAHRGLAGWELVSGEGGVRPILYLKRSVQNK